MQAQELLQEGRIAEALEALKAAVRKDPARAELRTFMFQFYAVTGDWERALTQLNVAGDLDPSTLAMVATYREALNAEALRAAIYAGQRAPLIFGEPAQWLALLLEALQASTLADGAARAKALCDQAFEIAPTSSGRINDEAFEWLADADCRLGPVLEVVMNGKFYWVPVNRISRIAIEPPADLRDLVWLPAVFTWATGGEGVGLIPTRYPGSERSDDPSVLLARRTEWQEAAPGYFVGIGQRMLATDAGDYPLLDVRSIEIDAAPAAG